MVDAIDLGSIFVVRKGNDKRRPCLRHMRVGFFITGGLMSIKLSEVLNKMGVPDEGAAEITLSQVPRKYQIQDARQHLSWNVSNNFSTVGTGKSLVSYLYIMSKLLAGGKVIVIMPPPLIPQYMNEFCNIVQGDSFSIETWNIPVKERNYRKNLYKKGKEAYPDILIMSYQLFVKEINLLCRSGHYNSLIADEAHAAKTSTTRNWAGLFRVVYIEGWSYLGMTGTPITRDLDDAYAYIKLKNRDIYRTLEQFQRMHLNTIDVGGFKKLIGYKNEADIHKHLNFQSVRRRASEVLSMDEPIIIEHTVQLSPEHMNFYNDFIEDLVIEMGNRIIVADNQSALRMIAMRLVTTLEMYTPEKIDDQPLGNLQAVVDGINTKETKVIVFCHFTTTVEKLRDEFKHLNPALMYSKSHQVNKFQKDDACRMFISNMGSGGAGFNLQDQAHHVIFYEVSGSPAIIEQCIGRVQRSGQKYPVIVWIFNYTDNFWKKLLKSAMGRDVDTSQALMDKKTFLQQLYLTGKRVATPKY